jgi:hypothetical protein
LAANRRGNGANFPGFKLVAASFCFLKLDRPAHSHPTIVLAEICTSLPVLLRISNAVRWVICQFT